MFVKKPCFIFGQIHLGNFHFYFYPIFDLRLLTILIYQISIHHRNDKKIARKINKTQH